jgi:[lysine-biosynthesis-protein LysW]---L-2-aminoadipate ligase
MSPLLIAGSLTPTNVGLLDACRRIGAEARLLPPDLAERRARAGEIVVGRVDVRPTLDGVEAGIASLRRLEESAIVLNCADAVLRAHDKLQTAESLLRRGIPHPRTAVIEPGDELPELELPLVLKPRFGSWGADVVRCRSLRELQRAFAQLSSRRWFLAHGVIVQELLPPPRADLRLIVADGLVVGAISREAAPGEWRTNVALGGTRRPAVPSAEARELAVAAAAAIGAELVGVDLLPTPDGYVVLELNGCVDFTPEYSFAGGDVYADAIQSLLLPHLRELATRVPLEEADLRPLT